MLISILEFGFERKFTKRHAEKLRGFFANLYKDNDLFHNHQQDGRVIYRYPLIQYKIINGKLVIIGLKEGADLVRNEFIKHESINLDGEILSNFEISLKIVQVNMQVEDSLYSYQFNSIWLPLNDKNYRIYKQGKFDLNKALQNNLLSDLKGLGITAEKRIMVKGNFREKKVMVDNKQMTGFVGDFVCNVKIPEFAGTGKRKSIGFGTIVGKG